MKTFIENISTSVSHLLFPHNCLGCATDILNGDDLICARCAAELPVTNYFKSEKNPVEKTFYGRAKVENAAANFYYTKDSLMQHLMGQLKYKGNREVGHYFGRIMGIELKKHNRFNGVEALIPLPLNEKKEFKRGYNQAMEICKGIASVWQRPIINNAVIRTIFTETQTHENRVNRWLNMEGVFAVVNPKTIERKHILLVDDIVTTGATLESCGAEILKVANTTLSIACAACAS